MARYQYLLPLSLSLIVTLLLFITPLRVNAQHQNAAVIAESENAIARATIERRQEELKSNATGLDADSLSQLSTLYNSALINLDDASNSQSKAGHYQSILKDGDQKIAQLQQKLDTLQAEPDNRKIKFAQDIKSTELQRLLDQKEAAQAAIKTKIANLDSERSRQTDIALIIRQRITAIKRDQETTKEELQNLRLTNDGSLFRQAKQWSLTTKLNALRAEANALDLELISKPTQEKITVLERAIEIENEKDLTNEIEQTREALSNRRNDEIKTNLGLVEMASQATEFASPEIQQYTQKSQDLTLELAELTENLDKATTRSEEVFQLLTNLQSEFSLLKQKTEVAGLSRIFGQVLLEQRNRLPSTREFAKEHRDLKQQITSAGLRRLELNNDLSHSPLVEDDAKKLQDSLASKTKESVQGIKTLTEYRANLIQRLDENNSALIRTLSGTDYDLSQLVEVIDSLDTFLFKQLIWVKTYKSIFNTTLSDLTSELNIYKQIATNFSFKEIAKLYINTPTMYLFLALTLILLTITPRIKRLKIHALNSTQNAHFVSTTWSIKYLSYVALQSLLVTACVIQTFYIVFSLLTPMSRLSILLEASIYSFMVDFLTRLLAPNQIFTRYFHWPHKLVNNLYRGFLILRNVLLPLYLINLINNGIFINSTGGVIGAILITLIFGVFTYAIHRIFSVRFNITASIVKRTIYGQPSRNQQILHYTLAASFVLWVVVFLSGYRYSAVMLSALVFESMLALAYILVAHQVGKRWLADLELREHLGFGSRKPLRDDDSQENANALSDKLSSQNAEESLKALSTDSKKLIDAVFTTIAVVTLALIWGRILPALTMFDFVLWSYSSKVAGVDQQVPITLMGFATFLIFVPVAIVAIRRLPAFVEMVVLNHLNLTAGTRYTIRTLLSYCLIAAAISIAATSVGFGWHKIQWAVAALSVGIGFGLQEIVANFISGLIILFERPIRVGDLVTINGQTGYVTRIQIRATTIRDYDNKELLVPNKEFITNSLLNWTLTDKEVRVMISVGVAYGSDVEAALHLLEEAAINHPLVLSDPKPLVTFESFGDNSLSLFLRCRIASIEDRLKVVNELHQSINKKYQAANINIAFPQRDIHIDFTNPLELRRAKKMPEAEEA